MKHWLEYKLKNPDRMTTKAEWKRISQWLRICRNKTEKAIDTDKMIKAANDAVLYGIGVCQPNNLIYGKSPVIGYINGSNS